MSEQQLKALLTQYFAAMDAVYPIRMKGIERELRKYAASVETGPTGLSKKCETTLDVIECDGGTCAETKDSRL